MIQNVFRAKAWQKRRRNNYGRHSGATSIMEENGYRERTERILDNAGQANRT